MTCLYNFIFVPQQISEFHQNIHFWLVAQWIMDSQCHHTRARIHPGLFYSPPTDLAAYILFGLSCAKLLQFPQLR